MKKTTKSTKFAKRLALPAADPSLAKPTVVAPLCMTHVQKQIEQVGSGYESLKKKYAKLAENMQNGASAQFEEASDVDQDETSDSGEELKRDRANSRDEFNLKLNRQNRSIEQHSKEALSKKDLYAILQLEHKTWKATEKEIKKAYQKMALVYHPDKVKNLNDEGKELWLLVQKGLNTLTDPAKRRRYDSTLEFDDNIPEKGDWETEEEFYTMFEEVFERNSMWSLKRPHPSLGNKDTPIADVRAFYKFWDNFETWREFAQHDEHDEDAIENAQERAEKRWMQNENKRIRAKYEKKERARLIKLSETCYQNDPRILKELAEVEAEKERAKQAKKDYKAQQAYEKDRVQREAAEKAAAEAEVIAQAEKKSKEADRIKNILYRTQVKMLIELCKIKMSGTTYDKFWVESVQKRENTTEKISPIVEALEKAESQQEFIDFMTSDSDRAKAQQDGPSEEAKSTDDSWNDEEIAQLTLAIQKFPVGTPNRWDALVAAIGGTKTQKEVTKKCAELANKKQADAEKRKAREAQTKAVEEMKAAIKAEEKKQIDKAMGIVPAKAEEPAKVQQSQRPQTATAQKNKQNAGAQGKNAAPAKDDWTAELEQQLLAVEKNVPKNVGAKQRFERIAQQVEGMTGQQCFEKFKALTQKAPAKGRR